METHTPFEITEEHAAIVARTVAGEIGATAHLRWLNML
jgi:hypothetical protein